MRIAVIALVMAGLVAPLAFASDDRGLGKHLEPSSSSYTPRMPRAEPWMTEQMVSPLVQLRFFAMGSVMVLDTDWLALWEEQGKMVLVRLHDRIDRPAFSRCKVEIPRALSERVLDLWGRVLLKTHYDETPRRGLDGADYVFYARGREGMIWSPQADTEPGMMLAMAGTMGHYCETKDRRDLDALAREADALSHAL